VNAKTSTIMNQFFSVLSFHLRQGGYVIIVVCLLATLRKNFHTDLHEIFRQDWQWANEQMIKFWWLSGPRIWIRSVLRLPIS